MIYRSTPGQREALVRTAREFDAIRQAFDLQDRMREAEYAEYAVTDAVPVLRIADWEHLFNAVKARLRQAGEAQPTASAAGANGRAASLQAVVLESVAALDQLHAMLAHELGRRDGLQALDERFVQGRAVPVESHHPVLALLYVDLDGVRSIGDAYGSDVVAVVLAAIAARVARGFDAQDMVVRLGGDALACLLQGRSDREQLGRLAEELVAALSAPMQVGGLELTVRPTIGMATSPIDGHSAAALLRCADAAVTRARREKTGYAFFEERIDG